ncbi:MAG: class I SAM-dependent RNA methyltransferase [bacterium]|nr:class I SAM-dependent RNA methyltransferase [bacterium]
MENSFDVLKLDHNGRGIIKKDGKTIFVPGATIGDTVKIKIVKDNKNYSVGNITCFIKKSCKRRERYCKYFDKCGGCSIGNLKYEEQLKYKEEKIKNIINRFLKEDIKINPIIYSKDLKYRNKITLHIKNGKIGLYKEQSNDIVDITECALVSDEINKLIKRVRRFLKRNRNNVREVVIRTTCIGHSMIKFIGDVNEDKAYNSFEDIDSIVINDKIIGARYITEELGKYKFKMSCDSFFQVNRFNTINLYNEVCRVIKGKKINKLIDLYCGTGTITIFVCKNAFEVLGIEKVESAVEAARLNRAINGASNVSFIDSKTENIINKFDNIDCIITDPPRCGMDKVTIDNLRRIASKMIIYVSCDAMTLVRDLNMLKDIYEIKEITPVDMFPNTHHVESIAVLERR